MHIAVNAALRGGHAGKGEGRATTRRVPHLLPCASPPAPPQEIRIDGTGIPELLKGIMQLMPLDETTPPAILMGMMP